MDVTALFRGTYHFVFYRFSLFSPFFKSENEFLVFFALQIQFSEPSVLAFTIPSKGFHSVMCFPLYLPVLALPCSTQPCPLMCRANAPGKTQPAAGSLLSSSTCGALDGAGVVPWHSCVLAQSSGWTEAVSWDETLGEERLDGSGSVAGLCALLLHRLCPAAVDQRDGVLGLAAVPGGR